MSPAAADKSSRESNENVRRLVDRAQQGDRDALEELYLIHFDRIYGYLHMSVGNRHDAEDLTTQTFLKMLESIGRFRWRSALDLGPTPKVHETLARKLDYGLDVALTLAPQVQ